ncbi:MAG: toxin-antitoxin system, antitoxin component [Bacteroidota bacterium]
MPQVSLYIDNETFKKIGKAAKIEKKSISKWVSSKIITSLSNSWPTEWFNLFGSLNDETFTEPDELRFSEDNKREKL